MRYDWPGNVRELENAIQRSLILSEGGEISLDEMGLDQEDWKIPDTLVNQEDTHHPANLNNNAQEADDLSLEDYFQHFVLEHQEGMSETELAQKLGISRKCLWERRQRLGIPRPKKASSAASATTQ